jgi:hypothetical protein
VYLTAKPKDHKCLYADIKGLRRAGMLDKIENEGFNTLKNHGYHLEHNFGHGKENLSEALFILNLLAFYFHQIFSLSDYQYQTARADFSARTEYWNFIRSVFRMFLFDSWEQLLEKMNSPPIHL